VLIRYLASDSAGRLGLGYGRDGQKQNKP